MSCSKTQRSNAGKALKRGPAMLHYVEEKTSYASLCRGSIGKGSLRPFNNHHHKSNKLGMRNTYSVMKVLKWHKKE